MPRSQSSLQRSWGRVASVVPCLVGLYALAAKLVKDVVEDADLAPGSPVRLGTVILFTINWIARERLWPGEDREREELRFDTWVRAVQRLPVVLAERARPSWLFWVVWRMLARLVWWKKREE